MPSLTYAERPIVQPAVGAGRLLGRGAAALALLAALGGTAAAATLEIRVEGLRNGAGVVRLAVFATADDFLERGREFRTAIVPAAAEGIIALMESLPTGTYALSMFHDENDDDAFDQVAFGLPREGFGFSNDAPVLFSAPSFRAAAFEVREPLTRIVARMRYWTPASSGELPALESDAPPLEEPEAE